MTTLQPSLQIALQSNQLPANYLTGLLWQNNVIFASGTALLAEQTMTISQFKAVTAQQITTSFAANCKVPASFAGLVVLDIEWPVPVQQWFLYATDAAFFAAIKLRIDTIRGLLPKAKIGIYSIVDPPNFGDVTNRSYAGGVEWINGPWLGYVAAAAQHCFDNIDYLCPCVTAVWGPNDTAAQQAQNTGWISVSLQYCQKLMPSKLVAPVLRFVIYNSASKNNAQPVGATVIRQQINTIVSQNAADAIILWAGTSADVNVSTLKALGGIPSSLLGG